MSKGYIYAAREPGAPDVKIGRTRKEPSIRLKQLNGTGRLHDLEYEFILAVKDEVKAEKIAHDMLKKCRVRSEKEFFSCNPRRARKVMKSAAARVGRYHAVSLETGRPAGFVFRLLHRLIGGSLASLGLVLTTVLLFVLYVDPVARSDYATIMFPFTLISALMLAAGVNMMRKRS